MLIEYKVRGVTRFVVTRYETSGPDENGTGNGSCTTKGEYDNAAVAYEVGYALCKAEHETLGYPIGDDRIRYPDHPEHADAVEMKISEAIEALADRVQDASGVRP